MTVVHTYFYIVVDTQQGCHTLKFYGLVLGYSMMYFEKRIIFTLQVASQLDNLQNLLGVVLKVLLHALGRNQSTCVLQNMFATQRSLVFKVGFRR